MQVNIEKLNILSEIYTKKVLNLMEVCKDKIIVFDFDGALTEFKYAENRLLPCRDDETNEYFTTNNFYINCNVSRTLQFVINALFPNGSDDIYILSSSAPNTIPAKMEIIKKEFPAFRDENVYIVSTADEKMRVLPELYKKHKKEILFIEDTAKNLLNAEETFDFVRGYHISSLIP